MTSPTTDRRLPAGIVGSLTLLVIGWTGLLVPSLIRSIKATFEQTDAGIGVVVHAGDAGQSSNGYAHDGFSASFRGGGDFRPNIKSFAIEEAIHDYLLSMTLAGHFMKFPNLRVASVENGAEFLPDLFIVGGGVSKHADQFLHLLDLRTPIVPAVHRNNAGIIGAAALALA